MTDALLARLTVGVIFLYHGLVPKLLFVSPTELRMLDAHGLPHAAAALAGVAEILLGLAILLLRRQRWPLCLALAALILLLVDVAIFVPALLADAFNPVTVNLAASVLCVIALRAKRAE
ncbi:DoxX-like family protein [Pseudomonas flavescens]|uniref:DoxX-like family protein n=1 Tax=Phytopseudomonas flavescens TaxID=29435 RepID=A0A1G8PXB6_9GAMM|nr:DoxX-like family protein [Pseudomonas flavescens]SDI97008.1 DoxX-like family protein [Pseudomonas flavescens]